jgi:hypothetical protein
MSTALTPAVRSPSFQMVTTPSIVASCSGLAGKRVGTPTYSVRDELLSPATVESQERLPTQSRNVKPAPCFFASSGPSPRTGFTLSSCASIPVVVLVAGCDAASGRDLGDVWSLWPPAEGRVWADRGPLFQKAASASDSASEPSWRVEISSDASLSSRSSLTGRHDHCSILFDNLDLLVLGGQSFAGGSSCNHEVDVHIASLILEEPGGFRDALASPAAAAAGGKGLTPHRRPSKARNAPVGGRAGACAVLLHRRWVVLLGGAKPSTGETVQSVHVLDCEAGDRPLQGSSGRVCRWVGPSEPAQLPCLPSPVSRSAAAASRDGRTIYMYGGRHANGDVSQDLLMLETDVDEKGVMRPRTNAWRSVQCIGGLRSMPAGRYGHAMMPFVSDGNTLLLIVGGRRKPSRSMGGLQPTLSDVYTFDVDNKTWEYCPKLCELTAGPTRLVLPRFGAALCAYPSSPMREGAGDRSRFALLLWGVGDSEREIAPPALLRLPRGGNGYMAPHRQLLPVRGESSSSAILKGVVAGQSAQDQSAALQAADPPLFALLVERTAFYQPKKIGTATSTVGTDNHGVVDHQDPDVPNDAFSKARLRRTTSGVKSSCSRHRAALLVAAASAKGLLQRYFAPWCASAARRLEPSATRLPSVVCVSCNAAPVECLLLPCGHAVQCSSCASAAFDCPCCGRTVDSIASTIKPRLSILHRTLIAQANRAAAQRAIAEEASVMRANRANEQAKQRSQPVEAEDESSVDAASHSSPQRMSRSALHSASAACSEIKSTTVRAAAVARSGVRRSLYVKYAMTM